MASKPTYSPAASEALRARAEALTEAPSYNVWSQLAHETLNRLLLIADCIEAAERHADSASAKYAIHKHAELRDALAALRDSLGAEE